MDGADVTYACANCGARFAGRARMIYCCEECKSAAKRVRRRGYNLRPRERFSREARCEGCGAAFRSVTNGASRTGWTRCCSLACDRRRRSVVALLLKPAVVVTHRRTCGGCGSRFHTRISTQLYCSEWCRPSHYEWQPADRACCVCGQTFRANKWKRTCGDECGAEAVRRGKRAAKAKRRAVTRGRSAQSIDPVRVFDRDGWRCHLCGVKTPRELRGTCDPRAPELDHIVTLADGGAHTWGNVACACRCCNGAKSARSLGQLGLDFAA